MAAVTKIKVTLKTYDHSGAGTDSVVYLGIGGREFRIESKKADDYERGVERIYVLRNPPDAGPADSGLPGNEYPVRYPTHNDPSSDYFLDTETIDSFPMYFRYQPRTLHGGTEDTDIWILGASFIEVFAGDQLVRTYNTFPKDQSLWLGLKYGLYYYFPPAPKAAAKK